MISIVIPFKGDHKEASILINLLRQISENKTKVPYEVVIVDSSGRLNSNETLMREHVKIIHSDAKVGAARNIGVRESKGDIILFLDSDCSIPSGFINQIYDLIMCVEKNVGAIGGPVECVHTTSLIQKYLDYSIFTPFPRYQGDYTSNWRTFHKYHHPNTCNLAVKRHIFEDIGGFWEGEGEDVFFLLKMTKKGYEIKYFSQLKVYHHHPRKLRKLMQKYFRMGVSAAKLLLVFPDSPLMRQRLIRFLVIFLPALLILPFHPLLAFILPYGLLYTIYLKRTRSLRASLVYPLLDIILQILYATGFIFSFIKEITRGMIK